MHTVNIEDPDLYGFEQIQYVTRATDAETGDIVSYEAVNRSIITSSSIVKLPDNTEDFAAPVISLIDAPNLIRPKFSNDIKISFRTGVFLHVDIMVAYYQRSGGGSTDRTFSFTMHKNGMNIVDETKNDGDGFISKDSLVALGIISDPSQWKYKQRAEDWFALDYRVPTGVIATSKFMSDIGKFPVGGFLNNQAWNM